MKDLQYLISRYVYGEAKTLNSIYEKFDLNHDSFHDLFHGSFSDYFNIQKDYDNFDNSFLTLTQEGILLVENRKKNDPNDKKILMRAKLTLTVATIAIILAMFGMIVPLLIRIFN